MATTIDIYATSYSDFGSWSNQASALTNDTSYAYASGINATIRWIKVSEFDVSGIPSGATVTGIAVKVKHYESSSRLSTSILTPLNSSGATISRGSSTSGTTHTVSFNNLSYSLSDLTTFYAEYDTVRTSGTSTYNCRVYCIYLTVTYEVEAELSVDPISAIINGKPQSLPVSVICNTGWTATSDADWATLPVASGNGSASVSVDCAINTSGSTRTGHITIAAGNKTSLLTIKQSSCQLAEAYWSGSSGDKVYVTYMGDAGVEVIDIWSDQNTSTSDRTKTLHLATTNTSGGIATATIEVNQAGKAISYTLMHDVFISQIDAMETRYSSMIGVSNNSKIIQAGGRYNDSSWCPYVQAISSSGALTLLSDLSCARDSMGASATSSHAIFAGGYDSDGAFSAIDLYSVSTYAKTSLGMQEARYDIGSSTNGSNALFAGGFTDSGVTASVDIVTMSGGLGSLTPLSTARGACAAAMFGANGTMVQGGILADGYTPTDASDIYNSSGTHVGSLPLSQARGYAAACDFTTNQDSIAVIIAGGQKAYDEASDVVDAYNTSWTHTVLDPLSVARIQPACGKVYNGEWCAVFAGGQTSDGGGSRAVDSYSNSGVHLVLPQDLNISGVGLSGATLDTKAIFAGLQNWIVAYYYEIS